MSKESDFVGVASDIIARRLVDRRKFEVKRGAALLYQVTVDNNLEVMSNEAVRSPKRGDGAFQTDLCNFENKNEKVSLPRIVLEFKTSITTHDILTYSVKARRHKQIYPYLRYGMVASDSQKITRKFFTHNEALDFYVALGGLGLPCQEDALMHLIDAELEASVVLEQVAFGEIDARYFSSSVTLSNILNNKDKAK